MFCWKNASAWLTNKAVSQKHKQISLAVQSHESITPLTQMSLIGPIPWGNSGRLSRIVIVVAVVYINAQAACDSSDTW